MPPPRKHNRLTRDSRVFSGFKFYLWGLNITVILNLFQKFVIQKLGGNTESFKIHYGDGTATSSRNDKQSSCKTQCGGWSDTLSYNDITNLCKTLVSGAAATLPHRGEGISNYNQIIYNNQPSPQPSPTGEEVSNYKMLKQVQHDTNSSKRTYSPIHLFSYSPCKRCAFTLAEVLITLGIIGVVAAMTMPSVIGHYKKQETISKLKKAYTSISQALKMSEIDNGEFEYWENGMSIGAGEYLQKYWLPYFNVLKICNKYTECGYKEIYPWNYLNGSKFKLTCSLDELRIPFITGDGILYSISIGRGSTIVEDSKIYIDLNGPKNPNILGKDLFVFERVKGKGILPACYNYTKNQINANCSSTSGGICCAQKIISDGWQISKDYPY